MSEKNWHLPKEINHLRHQMNHLFDELVHGNTQKTNNHALNSIPQVENATWQPAIEIKETDSCLILQVQVPGIEPKDLEIHVSKDAVSIAGEHEEQKVHYETGIYRSEFNYGHFQRIIPLPICVEHKQVKAEIHNGLLTLNLPKTHTEKHDVIKIDLTMEERAREAMAQQLQHQEHIQETMHSRTASELENPNHAGITEQARVEMIKQLQHDELLEENMHYRTESELDASSSSS
ncbi:Hsp20/alpha crystallin family protein [Plectonema cf. radiosum LEGE 06105]|uniref:Hsp20/alpha crystallin family protein n=1 Tax=Plectonema cf. radiosum LEGE 06105 TaxID=945769 RepID=A0A8J7F157_9CYAN|nr:Hsp20/alpha crystallin family protein [Plectonema radiosum]MBE9214146.1 Hsp20/alpha crystallin family protein [Plectonema cf. radiosum LEGE 06105]